MSAPPSGPVRKRRRQAVVCTECRRRKIACDRGSPCTQCTQSGSACTYYNSYATNRNNQPNNHTRATSTDAPYPMPISQEPLSQEPSFTPDSALEIFGTFPHSSAAIDAAAFAKPPVSAAENIDAPTSTWFETPPLSPESYSGGASYLSLLDPRGTSTVGLSHKSNTTRDTTSAFPQPPPTACSSSSTDTSGVRFQKSRVYGPSHWMNMCSKYEQQGIFDDVLSATHSERSPSMQKCKRLGKGLKSRSGPEPQLMACPLPDLVPSWEVCKKLVQLYFQTFESVFRVLHIPTFQREYEQYWINPMASSEDFILQMLLVMAIGTCFLQDDTDSGEGACSFSLLHHQARRWIQAAHVRLSGRQKHLNLGGVQAQCLLVLALLTNANAGGELLWVNVTASLIQNAMIIGLNIAPSLLPNITACEAEIRRRLWVTLLELGVQASLSSGIPPIITAETFHEPPSNLNDSQFSESTKTLPSSQPATNRTQSSMQLALLRTLPARLEIAETLNRFRNEPHYDTARQIGVELAGALRETLDMMEDLHPTPPTFQMRVHDILVRRFLHILHAQFAYKAIDDVRYHYSRSVAMESALILLSPASAYDDHNEESSPKTSGALDDHFAMLRIRGDGLFKNIPLAAAMTVSAELLLKLREGFSPLSSGALSLARQEMLQRVEETAALTRRRIAYGGETSVKAHALFVGVLAKIRAASRPGRRRPTSSMLPSPQGGSMMQSPKSHHHSSSSVVSGGSSRPGTSNSSHPAISDAVNRTLAECSRILDDKFNRIMAGRRSAATSDSIDLGAPMSSASSSSSSRPSRPQPPPPAPPQQQQQQPSRLNHYNQQHHQRHQQQLGPVGIAPALGDDFFMPASRMDGTGDSEMSSLDETADAWLSRITG